MNFDTTSAGTVPWTEARYIWMALAVWLFLAVFSATVSTIWLAYALGWYHAKYCG